MNESAQYFTDVMVAVLGLYFLVFILIGRVKGKSIVREYKLSEPGYNAFKRIVNNNQYLLITVIVTLFFVGSAIIDGQELMRSEFSNSILIVAPIFCVIGLIILTFISRAIFKKDS